MYCLILLENSSPPPRAISELRVGCYIGEMYTNPIVQRRRHTNGKHPSTQFFHAANSETGHRAPRWREGFSVPFQQGTLRTLPLLVGVNYFTERSMVVTLIMTEEDLCLFREWGGWQRMVSSFCQYWFSTTYRCQISLVCVLVGVRWLWSSYFWVFGSSILASDRGCILSSRWGERLWMRALWWSEMDEITSL